MEAIKGISKSYTTYRLRIHRRKEVLNYAKSISTDEIIFNLQILMKLRGKAHVLRTLLSITNSSIWLSRSAFTVLKSYFDISSLKDIDLDDTRSLDIVEAIAAQRPIEATDQEIFKTIYHEISHSHLDPRYQSKLAIPSADVTIVLVPGVFNEIFSTPAFKRGAEDLLSKYNIKYMSPKISGKKSSKENALSLKDQIDEYLRYNPKEKLWFFCFSKGGVDTLHYLKNEGEDLSPNILGVSFIATPIMGSELVNNKILQSLTAISNYPEALVKKVVGADLDLLARDLQKSLSKNFREGWFKRNHKKLPSSLFYTAIAFESKWHQSHVWMMLAKAFFRSPRSNDGVVDVENAQFPYYFNGINLGVLEGHHLVGSRSSLYDQEALMKAHLVFLNYKQLLKPAFKIH